MAFHHPVFSVAGDGDNPALRAAWKPLFDKYEVDLVLTGHDHTYGRGENLAEGGPRRDDAGTVYVVSVSGPKMNEVGKDRSWATRTGAHLQLYQAVHVSPQSLRFEARTVSGQLFDAFEITKSRTGRRRFIDRKPELSGTLLTVARFGGFIAHASSRTSWHRDAARRGPAGLRLRRTRLRRGIPGPSAACAGGARAHLGG